MTAQTNVEKSLASSMAAAFAEIEGATKAGNNPHFQSKYATLETVIAAIKPPLMAHGLFFTQHCHPSETGVIVETVLGHAGGESISLGSLYVPANKKDPQGFGSALTYARRYGLMTAFGVPAEDDDGNAAVTAVAAAKSETIDEHQWATILQLIEASGTDTKAFCAYYKCASADRLPADKYESAVASLNAKIAKKAKEPA